ncbi:putative proton pump-interactor [Helianthus annuus]|nr:putative proton pump-interactor [Helianthus annuus]KAJ0662330.1 putative proton pump-interactor [Helianthus annuus]KAJ0669857.1 putative proton pump-interactor [Helianthus annuus]
MAIDGVVSVENGHVGENESGPHVSESVRVEKAPEPSFPKDAVDEWPEEKKFHSLYFVKYRTVEDQALKAKLDQADKDLKKLNLARDPITEKLRAKRNERAQVIGQLKALVEEKNHFRTIMDGKRKEIEPLQQALGKLRGPNNANRDNRAGYICSSEEELNDVIKSMQYRIQHESITLNEEKQIIREIKQLEGTRDKVIANAAMRAEVQKSVGEKDAIQDQVKSIGVDLDGVRKDQQAIKAKLKTLETEKEAINGVIASLEEELRVVIEKRDKVYDKIRELRNKREEGNTCFYQNRSLLNDARRLAASKDVNALIELSTSEVDKFMSEWNSSKAFREDYEKRILQSLDMRQLSKDGRMRNPEEEIAKAKQALERKKKLAEKAAVKAKKKAEKEAEKKLKDREKKEKKKMQASMPAAEEATVEEAAVEEEKETTVKPPPTTKTKETIKVRGRGKGPESLSKVILKRKKSNNYMYYYYYAAAGAAAIMVVVLAVGYNMYA